MAQPMFYPKIRNNYIHIEFKPSPSEIYFAESAKIENEFE